MRPAICDGCRSVRIGNPARRYVRVTCVRHSYDPASACCRSVVVAGWMERKYGPWVVSFLWLLAAIGAGFTSLVFEVR